MKRSPFGAALILALAAVTGAEAQDVAGFDDLVGYQEPVPADYHGLQWSNFFFMDAENYWLNPSGYQNGMVSNPNVIYNGWGTMASFWSADLFTFNGAFLTAAWNQGLQLDVKGYAGGTELYSTVLTLGTAGPQDAVFDWTGVDRVTFDSYGGTDDPGMAGAGTHFVLDNLTVNGSVVDVNVVPEPVTLLLLGTGLLGLAGAVYRRRHRHDDSPTIAS